MRGVGSGDDASLIRAFLDGERAAVFQLTRWISLELRAHGVTFRARQREDLLQETLLRLCKVLGRGEWRGDSGLQRYVRAIARHVVADHFRRRGPVEVTAEADGATEIVEAATAGERLAERDVVARVLAGLSEEDGRLLIEAYVEERSYADMAAARSIGRGALKVRVFRAARRAREVWTRLAGAPAVQAHGRVTGAGS